MGFSYENVAGVISTLAYATPFYNGTWAEFNRTFAEFLAIPSTNTTLGPLSYNDITKILPPDAAESEGVRSFRMAFILHLFIVIPPPQHLVRTN
jgi:hypothetical protein